MANTFLTPDIIAREALLILRSQTVMSNLVYRDHAQEFTAAKVGDTITIRKPATFEAKSYAGSIVVQNATETGIPLVLEEHFDVSFAITSKDRTLSLENFSRQLIRPAVIAIAEKLDQYMLSKYKGIPNFTGTAGSPPASLANLAAIDRVMNDLRIPADGRNAVVNPAAKQTMLGIGDIVRADAVGDAGTRLRTASFSAGVMGLNWYMAQNVSIAANHTAGTLAAGSPLVNVAVAAGATTMNIDGGVGTETIAVGDIFTVAGVNNPLTGAAMQFTFTAAKTATAGAITGATFYPAAPTGGFANNAAITIVASHIANLAFNPNAFALATVPLDLPVGAAEKAIFNFEGLGIRVVMDYDMNTKTDTVSLDMLAGAVAQQPEFAVRVLG